MSYNLGTKNSIKKRLVKKKLNTEECKFLVKWQKQIDTMRNRKTNRHTEQTDAAVR
jgi:hypothetical protein